MGLQLLESFSGHSMKSKKIDLVSHSLLSQKGQSIIQVLVGVAMMGILMSAFASMMYAQNREARAMKEILASLDLQKTLSSSLVSGQVCQYVLTNPTALTFDSQTISTTTPQTVHPSLPMYASIVQGTPQTPGPIVAQIGQAASVYSNSVIIDDIRLVIDGAPSPMPPPGPSVTFLGHWLISFDNTKLVRPLKPVTASTTIIADTTNPAAAVILGCMEGIPVDPCDLPWGGTIKSGASVNAWDSAGNCEVRMCLNGKLTGSNVSKKYHFGTTAPGGGITLTIPAGAAACKFTATGIAVGSGGGGGGGGCNGSWVNETASCGGGGGSGGTSSVVLNTVAGDVYTAMVAVGGSAGPGQTPGGNGGTSSLAKAGVVLISAGGGFGGSPGFAGSAAGVAGGAGGVGNASPGQPGGQGGAMRADTGGAHYYAGSTPGGGATGGDSGKYDLGYGTMSYGGGGGGGHMNLDLGNPLGVGGHGGNTASSGSRGGGGGGGIPYCSPGAAGASGYVGITLE